MKFNSQICTSKEQSKRLLALGLKKETADMHWRLQPYYNDEGFDCGIEWSCNMGTFLQDDAYELFLDYIPAWSLHRLLLLLLDNRCVAYDHISFSIDETDVFTKVINHIEWLIKEGYFPKEYLV